jgi:hypothetical protein
VGAVLEVAHANCEGGVVSGAAPVGSVFNGASVFVVGITKDALLYVHEEIILIKSTTIDNFFIGEEV